MIETGLWQIALLLVLVALPAPAQSVELLEAVRLQQPGVVGQAQKELAACAKARCADLHRLALLTGFLELSWGDAPEAAKHLASAPAPRGLEVFHSWYFGEAQAWAGQKALALKTFGSAKKKAPPWFATRIGRRMAELYLDLKAFKRARALIEADPEASSRPELLYTRALARQSSRAFELARADWKLLALNFPGHPHGQAAQFRLELDGAWNPTFEEELGRAQALLGAGDPERCLQILDTLTLPPEARLQGPAAEGTTVSAPQATVALLKGRALLARAKERDHEAQAQLAAAASGPPSIAAQALMISGRRLMRIDDNSGARTVFRRLDQKYSSDPAAEEAGYLAAWLSMNLGDLDAAQNEFEAFEARHADSKRRDEARWFRGFTLIRAKQHDAARAVLATLPADFPRSALVPQALYWAARAAELRPSDDAGSGASVDVAAEYRAVIHGFPGNFYALLASERLRELHLEAPAPFAVSPKQLQVRRPPELDLAAALARTGLFRDAAEETGRALRAMRAADALVWGHALQAIGDYGAAHALAARYLWGAAYGHRSPEALALMYPRAYRSSVERWAAQHEVETSLAWAIMRRESAFAPEVTSPADARGLMQIIPPTAKSISLELGLPPTDDTELYSPDWNIRLGTWYLRALTQRLHHPSLVAAAYNGGPTSVVRWAKERRELPLDLWIEEIPLKETRAYVKQVTCDLFIYRQLYQGGATKPLSWLIPAPASGVEF